jgi:hypothetical protein
MGADVRKKGPDALQDSHKIDVEHPSPSVERDVIDATPAADAGIVADHMDLPERLV